MRFGRRQSDRERVRVTQRNLPTLSGIWAEEIMRLRRVMNEALRDLYAGNADQARRRLSAALAERWWR